MWTIRKAVPEDLTAVLRLFDDAVAWLNACGNTVQWGSTPVSSRAHLVRQIEDEIGCGWIAEDGEILGFIAVDGRVPDTFTEFVDAGTIASAFYVHSLVAARTPQARGAGRALLRHAEEHTRASGHPDLLLTCWGGNTKLIAYYEAAGFIPCGVHDDGDRREQHFRKPLS